MVGHRIARGSISHRGWSSGEDGLEGLDDEKDYSDYSSLPRFPRSFTTFELSVNLLNLKSGSVQFEKLGT